MVKHCYIHIPFCKKICSYCDFCKLFYNTGYVSSYLKTLENEIQTFYQGEELDTLYIGGGTPSCLSMEELEQLFVVLSGLKKSSTCEVTIEANFDSITKEKLDLFVQWGINRISFGLETTHPWLLQKMNRSLDLEYVKEIISYCKSIGLDNINLDLMYAFPSESMEEVEEDLDFILSLDVTHISTYSLILEEHTKLYLNGEKVVSEDLDALMYERICSKLSDYDHYEISNFSKDGFYSKHNLCYWKNDSYYGFGLGASGYLEEVRYQNTRSITRYLETKYRYQEEKVTICDKIEYEILLNLRTKWGISKNDFFTKYHQEFLERYPCSSLLLKGYLKEEKDRVYIPEEYWYLSNEVIVKVLEEKSYE